jgi:hypothetical protein
MKEVPTRRTQRLVAPFKFFRRPPGGMCWSGPIKNFRNGFSFFECNFNPTDYCFDAKVVYPTKLSWNTRDNTKDNRSPPMCVHEFFLFNLLIQ